jgi:riboflavin kinase/FMN adenylyltransferase
LDLDLMVLLPFDRKVAATPARDFMEAVSRYLRIRELWVGGDFALGRNREGDVGFLRQLGEELEYGLKVIEPLVGGAEVISSSRIRALLREGNVEDAAQLLGRFPSLSGEVVVGVQRGRDLGFATANLEVRPERAIPADGVYAVFALLGTERFPAVANVGVRPSFDNGQRTVETHLFEFNRSIYGCDLVVEFVARLRPERRFEQIADLVAQIQRDSDVARQILSGVQQDSRCWPPMGSSTGSGHALQLRSEQVVARDRGAASRGEPLGSLMPAPCVYRYEEIGHTADRALRVQANSLPDLFVGAARGMYSLMGDLDGLVATTWHQIQLEDWDRESLLVGWLNELLFLTESEGLIFVESRIESLTDTTLAGWAGGMRASPARAMVKAATFHDLVLVQDGEEWSTVITFDV